MIICEFCVQYRIDGKCELGLNIPKQMGCREFDPGLERFCANPNDFVNPGQIKQMATFFGIKGTELKKVQQMAARGEKARLLSSDLKPDTLQVRNDSGAKIALADAVAKLDGRFGEEV
jgi:hypothetical protein